MNCYPETSLLVHFTHCERVHCNKKDSVSSGCFFFGGGVVVVVVVVVFRNEPPPKSCNVVKFSQQALQFYYLNKLN